MFQWYHKTILVMSQSEVTVMLLSECCRSYQWHHNFALQMFPLAVDVWTMNTIVILIMKTTYESLVFRNLLAFFAFSSVMLRRSSVLLTLLACGPIKAPCVEASYTCVHAICTALVDWLPHNPIPIPSSSFLFFFSDLAVKSKLALFMATFFTSQCDVSAHSDVTVNSHGEIIRWLHCEEIWGYILRSWWSFFGLAVWCFSSQWCHSKLTWWDHQMTSLWRNMRLHFEVMVKFFWTRGVMFQLTVMSQ